jgi:hypothetical protein
MESMWIPCGICISEYMIYVVKHIPCGIHVESMDSTWNKSVPHGFHVECGGMVKYWCFGCKQQIQQRAGQRAGQQAGEGIGCLQVSSTLDLLPITPSLSIHSPTTCHVTDEPAIIHYPCVSCHVSVGPHLAPASSGLSCHLNIAPTSTNSTAMLMPPITTDHPHHLHHLINKCPLPNDTQHRHLWLFEPPPIQNQKPPLAKITACSKANHPHLKNSPAPISTTAPIGQPNRTYFNNCAHFDNPTVPNSTTAPISTTQPHLFLQLHPFQQPNHAYFDNCTLFLHNLTPFDNRSMPPKVKPKPQKPEPQPTNTHKHQASNAAKQPVK